MKTYQIWFVNEEVLLIQAERTNAINNLAIFYAGDDMIAAFSFEQILGFCALDSILSGEDDDES